MLFQPMDLARFIQIYVVQGIFGFFYLFMAYRILKRDTKRLNLMLSAFYLSTSVGVIINIIYANLYDETIVYALHFATYFFLCLSLSFLFLFVLNLLKSGKKINLQAQLLLILIFSALLLGLLFVPNGITINKSTNWKPQWSWGFFIYSLIVCSAFTIGPTIYCSIKIYQKFESDFLKKKWKYFGIGIFAYFFLYYGTSLSNTLNNDNFRLIWSLFSLPTLISLFLIYYGMRTEY